MIVTLGTLNTPVYLAMMLLAWNVSGGHFNPAITLGVYISEWKFKDNAVIAGIMFVSQFLGAMLGILFGFLALVDASYMNDTENPAYGPFKSVPPTFLYLLIPVKPSSNGRSIELDFANGEDDSDWTRDWQTFWGIFLATTFLTLVFVSVKSKHTAISEDKLAQCFLIVLALNVVSTLCAKFGGAASAAVLIDQTAQQNTEPVASANFNPALASASILWVQAQYSLDSDIEDQVHVNRAINHYLWAYMIAPLVGGVVGGILHKLHAKVTAGDNVDGDDGKEESLLT